MNAPTAAAAGTGWRISVGREQYGGFADREEAELEATRRRALGADRVEVYEVWLSNPYEHVVGVAQCERCGERMPRFDGRVVSSPESIICGPCSVEKFGYWCEEPTIVESWPVEHVDEAGEYRRPVGEMREHASAFGDFRTYETTFAAMGDGDLVQVQLISDRGAHAHFAMDRQVAARVAKELERQLSEASFQERQLSKSSWHDRYLLARPPKLAPLADSVAEFGTDVFFTVDEELYLAVGQNTDRIDLTIDSEEASLHITMQGGVAVALSRFLARAGAKTR